MSKPNTSSSGTRILRVLKALRGHALNGVSNGELASALGESPANINRALNTLIEEGLALKLDNGRFAPRSPALTNRHGAQYRNGAGAGSYQ